MDTNLQLATMMWILATFLTLLCERAFADVPPELRREPTSKIVAPLSRVKLRCTADPKEADIRWTLNGEPIVDFPNIVVNGGSLIIKTFESELGSYSHVGNYQCIASTSVGSIASRVARLDLTYISRFTERPPSEVSASLGGVAVIPCTVPDSLPPARMEYSFKNRWIIEDTDHYRLLPSGNLHILNVTSMDAGLFSCLAFNPITNKRHSASNGTLLMVTQGEQDVDVSPRIAYANGDFVMRGEPATLECVMAGGRPALRDTRWEKMNGDLPSSGVTKRLGSLLIAAAALEDDGRYVCIGEYDGREVDRQYVTLKVTKPPSIRVGPVDITTSLGDLVSVDFSCSVGRAMPEEVRWLHNALEIQADNLKYSINGEILTVHSVSFADLGMYQCLVTNEQGSVQAAAQLTLSAGFPVIREPPINTTAIEGERVLLSCLVQGQPLPYITWQDPRNRTIRNTDKTYYISEDTGALTVFEVDLTDIGWYMCTASNKHGNVRAAAYLFVLEKMSSTPTTPTQGVLGPPFSGAISDSGITTIVDNNMEGSIKPGPPLEPPSKPQVAKISDTAVEVRWAYSSGGGTSPPVTHFTVQYMDVLSLVGWRTASNSIGPRQRSYQVTNLIPKKIYRFRVIASNEYGDSPHSEMSHRYLLQNHSPEVSPQRAPAISPRITRCQAESSSTIRVQWQYDPRPGDPPIEGFYVYIRHFDSDDDRDYVRTPVIGADVRSYLIEKLEPEETYDIKVECFNSAGESRGHNVMIRSTLPRETEPPPIIIKPVNPDGQPSDIDSLIPLIPDDPTLAPPHSSGEGSEDILYITLGVVLGAMLLVLIMFAVMCVWRAKQVNRDSSVPVHWNNQPYYDPSFRYIEPGKYQYMNGKLSGNHNGTNGVAGSNSSSINPYGETNGGIEARPLYALPQDALGGNPYIPCGSGTLHQDSAPETTTVPHDDLQLHSAPSPTHHSVSLSNGSLPNHHSSQTSSIHEINHAHDPSISHASSVGTAEAAPRPVCQIRVNPRYHWDSRDGGASGANTAKETAPKLPHRTETYKEALQGSDSGSLNIGSPYEESSEGGSTPPYYVSLSPPISESPPTPGSPSRESPPPTLSHPNSSSPQHREPSSSRHSANQSHDALPHISDHVHLDSAAQSSNDTAHHHKNRPDDIYNYGSQSDDASSQSNQSTPTHHSSSSKITDV